MRMKVVAFVLSVLAFVNVQAQTLQDGLGLIHTERFNEAEQLFKKLAEGTPSADNQYYLGYLYVKMDKLDEAQKAFEKGLQLDEKSYLNQVGLGTVALGKGDKAKAKALFDEAEKKKKKDAEVLYRIGEAYTLFEKNNDPAEAIRLLDEAIKRDKNLTDAYIAKGDALMLKNEGGPAVTAYEYALTAKPNYAVALNRIGQIYLQGKQYNLALENFKKAIDADPNFGPAYKDLAELYFKAQKYKQAAENYDIFMQKSGAADPKRQLRAAQFAFIADDYPKAIQILQGLEGKLDDPIIKRIYGWSYSKMNEPDKAISSITEFMKAAPEKVNAEDYNYLGHAYNEKAVAAGQPYDSVGMEYIMKSAALDTNKVTSAATYKEVAMLYYGAKDYDKAIGAFEKGIPLDSTAKSLINDNYYYGLSNFQKASKLSATGADSLNMLTAKRQLNMKADSIFSVVTTKSPEWPYGYYWRAVALYNAYDRQENVDKGISAPYYAKFAELAEKDDVSKYKGFLKFAYPYLAFYAQTTLKDEAKSKEYWQKLLAVDPDNANAKEALNPTPAEQPAAAAPKVAPKKK